MPYGMKIAKGRDTDSRHDGMFRFLTCSPRTQRMSCVRGGCWGTTLGRACFRSLAWLIQEQPKSAAAVLAASAGTPPRYAPMVATLGVT